MTRIYDIERARIRKNARRFAREMLRRADELRDAVERSRFGGGVTLDWSTGKPVNYGENTVVPFRKVNRHA